MAAKESEGENPQGSTDRDGPELMSGAFVATVTKRMTELYADADYDPDEAGSWEWPDSGLWETTNFSPADVTAFGQSGSVNFDLNDEEYPERSGAVFYDEDLVCVTAEGEAGTDKLVSSIYAEPAEAMELGAAIMAAAWELAHYQQSSEK